MTTATITFKATAGTDHAHGGWHAAECRGVSAPNRTWARWPPVARPTPLIAAMRCFVASKLGDEVDIPKELT